MKLLLTIKAFIISIFRHVQNVTWYFWCKLVVSSCQGWKDGGPRSPDWAEHAVDALELSLSPPIYLSIYLSIFLPIYQFIYLSIFLSLSYSYICNYIPISLYQFINPSTSQFSIYLFINVYLSIYFKSSVFLSFN